MKARSHFRMAARCWTMCDRWCGKKSCDKLIKPIRRRALPNGYVLSKGNSCKPLIFPIKFDLPLEFNYLDYTARWLMSKSGIFRLIFIRSMFMRSLRLLNGYGDLQNGILSSPVAWLSGDAIKRSFRPSSFDMLSFHCSQSPIVEDRGWA